MKLSGFLLQNTSDNNQHHTKKNFGTHAHHNINLYSNPKNSAAKRDAKKRSLAQKFQCNPPNKTEFMTSASRTVIFYYWVDVRYILARSRFIKLSWSFGLFWRFSGFSEKIR
ncbi:MAG: hypothetical protein CL943_03440 [Candidatus Diapherotrites archaeon]|uniref:Uncharacterized protein n=1 Tax=Candidatus Iainarchaeum sp. TaxID=3101447 RepID=A0A2D6M1M7_9ARCH|nr:hypothetical protein [Candidatus Diapherotrites archaeon]